MHHPDSPFPTYNAPRGHEALGENHGPPTDPGSRGLAAIAWISILALIGVVLVLNRLSPPAATGPVTVLPPDATMTLMGRYAMGAKSLTPANTDQLRPLVTQLDTLAVDRPEDRLRAAIIAGELMGPGRRRNGSTRSSPTTPSRPPTRRTRTAPRRSRRSSRAIWTWSAPSREARSSIETPRPTPGLSSATAGSGVSP